MTSHEFDIYIELYKRKEYKHIPIGIYPDGNYFYMTSKQVRTLELLNDEITTDIGYGGSARCFISSTYVNTSKGYKQIKDIKKGDYVLSYNEALKLMEYKQVIDTYCFEGLHKLAIFKNGIKSTHDHEYLFRGKWTKANELARRSLEVNNESLYDLKQRSNSINKLSRAWVVEVIKAMFKKRIRKNKFICRLSNEEKLFDSSASCNCFYSESKQLPIYKSHKSYSHIQLCRKFRVVYGRIQHQLCNGKFQESEEINERRSYSDKTGIFNEQNFSSNNWRKIWSFLFNCCRYSKRSYLVAREITDEEIKGIRFEYLNEPIYDLHVEGNHNYTVTKNNIIVHNSGKSIIECTAIIFDCFSFPDIAWGLARKELSTLKRTVLLTLFKQFEFYGIVDYKLNKSAKNTYNYNQELNKISFGNKSDVFLIDTAYKPSDPLNTRFGGFELTRSAIDESNETELSVVYKLFERTGWRNNDKYNLKRKQFECFNPAKNHVYNRYYVPFKEGTEDEHKKFIPALPADNPHPSVKEWINDLTKTGDQVTIQRQILGNFDYDDDPSALCGYDAICDIFTNDHVKGGTKYISADLAMQGRDKFIAGYWEGLRCTVAIDKGKSTGKSIELDLKELKNDKGVGNSNIVADSDGLGAYLESYIQNIKTFHGNATPKNKKEFNNLKSECGFKLAELINNREIKIICNQFQQEEIKKEISACLKRDNLDNDEQKKKLISKDKMKESLGHSPDYMDMLLMRMIFEVKKEFVAMW